MRNSAVLFLSFLILAGCGYQAQKQILQEKKVGNSQVLPGTTQAVYNAFLKTVLLKNFIIKQEDAAAGSVFAERVVERGRRSYVISLQARIFEDAPGKSTLFLNGSERCERSFIKDNTRFFLFVIPLPGGGGKEASSMVESVKPIRDTVFYDEIFAMTRSYLADISKAVSPGILAGIGSAADSVVEEAGQDAVVDSEQDVSALGLSAQESSQ